uniref:Uncharacterized protein n=1 Tax=Arundo donax TaxID=35708 RepID=A0A0A8YKF1_ARUDO
MLVCKGSRETWKGWLTQERKMMTLSQSLKMWIGTYYMRKER